jgi:DNA-binding MarR family transcriptional regulator
LTGQSEKAAGPHTFAVLNEIAIIGQLSGNAFVKVLPDGLQLAQFGVLNHMVRVGDGWTPVKLASAFQVTKGAMTNTLQRLEARALARIEPDPADGRSKRVFITASGRQMHARCVTALAPELAALERELGGELFTRLLPDLQALRAHLDTARSA